MRSIQPHTWETGTMGAAADLVHRNTAGRAEDPARPEPARPRRSLCPPARPLTAGVRGAAYEGQWLCGLGQWRGHVRPLRRTRVILHGARQQRGVEHLRHGDVHLLEEQAVHAVVEGAAPLARLPAEKKEPGTKKRSSLGSDIDNTRSADTTAMSGVCDAHARRHAREHARARENACAGVPAAAHCCRRARAAGPPR